MTQKELLYVEDAIEHEKNLIAYLEELTVKLEEKDITDFISKEISNHKKEEKSLLKLLEELQND